MKAVLDLELCALFNILKHTLENPIREDFPFYKRMLEALKIQKDT